MVVYCVIVTALAFHLLIKGSIKQDDRINLLMDLEQARADREYWKKAFKEALKDKAYDHSRRSKSPDR